MKLNQGSHSFLYITKKKFIRENYKAPPAFFYTFNTFDTKCHL